MTMENPGIYITSSRRSGSTLLEFLLGNHSQVTNVGELSKLKAYALRDRRLYDPDHPLNCLCGKDISNCLFWKRVEEVLDYSLKDIRLDLDEYYDWRSYFSLFGNGKSTRSYAFIFKLIFNIIENYPSLLNSKLKYAFSFDLLAKNNLSIYSAVSKINGVKYVVDSSKDPYKFKLIYDYSPKSIKVIYLIRNPTGFVWSQMKRGRSFRKALNDWIISQKRIIRCLEGVSQEDKYVLSYERLCKDTEYELEKLSHFLSIPYEKGISKLSNKDRHHIGGTPSKYYFNNIDVKFDDSFKDKMSVKQKSTIEFILKKSKWNPYKLI